MPSLLSPAPATVYGRSLIGARVRVGVFERLGQTLLLDLRLLGEIGEIGETGETGRKTVLRDLLGAPAILPLQQAGHCWSYAALRII